MCREWCKCVGLYDGFLCFLSLSLTEFFRPLWTTHRKLYLYFETAHRKSNCSFRGPANPPTLRTQATAPEVTEQAWTAMAAIAVCQAFFKCPVSQAFSWMRKVLLRMCTGRRSQIESYGLDIEFYRTMSRRLKCRIVLMRLPGRLCIWNVVTLVSLGNKI